MAPPPGHAIPLTNQVGAGAVLPQLQGPTQLQYQQPQGPPQLQFQQPQDPTQV